MAINNQYGTTALYKAAEGGHTDAVRLLLDRGSNIHAADKVSHCMCIHSITDCEFLYQLLCLARA